MLLPKDGSLSNLESWYGNSGSWQCCQFYRIGRNEVSTAFSGFYWSHRIIFNFTCNKKFWGWEEKSGSIVEVVVLPGFETIASALWDLLKGKLYWRKYSERTLIPLSIDLLTPCLRRIRANIDNINKFEVLWCYVFEAGWLVFPYWSFPFYLSLFSLSYRYKPGELLWRVG